MEHECKIWSGVPKEETTWDREGSSEQMRRGRRDGRDLVICRTISSHFSDSIAFHLTYFVVSDH